MASPVAIFNGSSHTISIVVNGGPQTTVNGTGPGQGWQPKSPSGAGPTYSPGFPEPNVIGLRGPNQIQAFVSGTPWGDPLFFSLPNGRRVESVQIYLFDNQGAKWLVLTDGVACAI